MAGLDRAAVSVRAAIAGDVPEVARIQLATWRTAYSGLLPPPMLAAATPERATAEWRAAVVHPPSPRHRVLVAREQDWTVGFAAFGPSEADGDPPGTGIVHVLLVEPRWGRRGHGSRLLAATVDHLRADGMTVAVAWLLDGDTASAAFYKSAGWARDGSVRTLADDTSHTGRAGHRGSVATVREARFHTSLEEGASLEGGASPEEGASLEEGDG